MKRRALCWVWLLMAACGDDFTPYQEIDRLRMLGIGADRPWLEFGDTANVSALIVQDSEDQAPISYEWSWCPLTAGADRAFECAFTEAELQQQIDDAVGPGVLEVPPYALGTTSSVAYSYELSPLLFSGLCDALGMQNLPDFVRVPRCEGTFPITIQLRVNDGDEELVGIRSLELVYDDAIEAVNHNPMIVRLTADDVLVAEDGSLELERDVDVALALELSEDSIERNGELSEEIVVSWFIDSGDLERSRTAFIEGRIDTLANNVWHTPRIPDWPDSSARLILVVRDDRRGLSWFERSVTLKGEETP